MDLWLIALGGGVFLGVMLFIRWLTRRDTRSDPADGSLPLIGPGPMADAAPDGDGD